MQIPIIDGNVRKVQKFFFHSDIRKSLHSDIRNGALPSKTRSVLGPELTLEP